MSTPLQTTDSDCPLRFERRRFERLPFSGMATATRLAGERFHQRHDLTLLDYSPQGLGAVSSTVLERGTMVVVGFRWPGCPDRRGLVLRCSPCGNGYRVAIRFELRVAA